MELAIQSTGVTKGGPIHSSPPRGCLVCAAILTHVCVPAVHKLGYLEFLGALGRGVGVEGFGRKCENQDFFQESSGAESWLTKIISDWLFNFKARDRARARGVHKLRAQSQDI